MKYTCECIECSHTIETDEHCNDLKCSECGGQMRREEKPGSGQAGSEAVRGHNSFLKEKGLTIFEGLASRIINTPLMVTQNKLNAVLTVAGTQVEFSTRESGIFGNVESKKSPVAIIPIQGFLTHKKLWSFFLFDDTTSYEEIRENLHAAMEDESIKEIVLDIDSSGGEVSGVFDLVDDIYNARGEKPITAIVNDMAYSAAYALASAADKIYMPKTGGIGSVGVIAMHIDQSSYDEKLGVKYTPIFAGKRKNDFSPHQELSSQALDTIQTDVNKIYDMFIDTVVRNRNISATEVRNMEAATYFGVEGVKAGLADEVLSWDQVVKTIVSKYEGGIIMSDVPVDPIEEIEIPVLELVEEGKVEISLGDLQDRVTQLEQDLSKANKRADGAEDDKRTMEILQDVRMIGVIGSPEKVARTLFTLEKIDPELYQEEMKRLEETSKALNVAGVFSEIGSSGEGSYSAYDDLVSKVKEFEAAGMSQSDAWKEAARANPGLYKNYRDRK